MMFFGRCNSKNSSEDAMNVAPCFRSAKKSFNSVSFAGIVVSMSVFLIIALCPALCLIDIIGIIILYIIITGLKMKKQTAGSTL